MNIPPFLIGAGVLFWGVETGRIIPASLLALILEGARVYKIRYRFDEDDFVRISDLTSLLFLGTVALVLLQYEAMHFLRITATWLPLVLSPLIAGQLFADSATIAIGTRLGRRSRSYTHRPIDFRVYYILVCLISAAAANSGSLLFFPGMAAIIVVLLVSNRGFSPSPYIFAGFIVVVFLSAFVAGKGIRSGYYFVMRSTMALFYDYYGSRGADPFQYKMHFGETGDLKYSSEIIMRVEAESPPALLKEASYAIYHRGSWYNDQINYQYVPLEAEEHWNLVAAPHPEGKKISVERSLPMEKGLLPHPYGAFLLKSRTIFRIEQHRNSSVKIVEGAPVAVYEIQYDRQVQKSEDIPLAVHLTVPETEVSMLEKVASSISPLSNGDAVKVASIRRFFSDYFAYSLKIVDRGNYATPLGNFLLNERQGFCEYYATATTLLLRTMNIPSRYTVGYAIAEHSGLENKYIIRSRHAHAWAEAYIGGRWIVVDTTPSEWPERDAQNGSNFEYVFDIVSFFNHKYDLYRIGQGPDYRAFLSFVVVLLTAFLAVKIYRRMRFDRSVKLADKAGERTFHRIVTPLTPLLDEVKEFNDKKSSDESVTAWVRRCGSWHSFDELEFARLYQLHLRMRFDPQGVSANGKRELRQGAEKYLQELRENKQESGKKKT